MDIELRLKSANLVLKDSSHTYVQMRSQKQKGQGRIRVPVTWEITSVYFTFLC